MDQFCTNTVKGGGWYKYDLSLAAQGVLLCLIAHSKSQGVVSETQQELADVMKVNRTTVAKGIKELIGCGVVSKGDRGVYLINEDIVGQKLA